MKIRLAIAAALLGLTAGAHAAEIIMFDAPGLNGRQLNVRAPMQDITTFGNGYDRTASVLVNSGTWEVCTDVNFHGFCATLQPGEYRVLDPRFNGRIMSVREVGPVVAQATPYNPPPQAEPRAYNPPAYEPRGAIELYGRSDFGGRSLLLERDAPNLEALGFNDRASSIVVREGRWELCSDAGFRGTCRVFEPGRYADVGPALDRQISSARMLQPRSDARPPVAYEPRPGPAPQPRIVLFDNENFRGRSLTVIDPLEDLRRSNFNNDAASVVVESGSWEVCSDSYYRGRCEVLLPGQYRRLDADMFRSISSLRPADASVDARGRGGVAAVELFEGINFDGRRRAVSEPAVPNLDARNFTDRASSMIIHEGQWEVCADAGYSGRCRVYGPGRYADLGRLNNEISSLRRIN